LILLSTIALAFVLLVVFYGIPVLEREARNYYFNRIKWKSRLDRHQFLRIDDFYASRFSYYKHLNLEGRAKFIYRALQYLEDWSFEGRRGVVIDQEKKLMVCGSAAQLTYGLTDFHIQHFENIILYPDTFYSGLAEAEVKGLTYSSGDVAFSWKHFEEGYQVENDGYNLALHEMAHALDVNLMKSYGTDLLMDLYFPEFIEQALPEYQILRQQGEDFLRERAVSNEKEFFAICVESFFERPQEFKTRLPRVYDHLCAVLQQDPLNTSGNYALRPDFITEANKTRATQLPDYKRFLYRTHAPTSQVLFSLMVIPGLVTYARIVELNPHQISLINYLALGGGLLFVLLHAKNEMIKNRGEFIMAVALFNFLRGATVCLFSVFILSQSVWNYPVHKRYPLDSSNVICHGSQCYLKDLPEFDFPPDYRDLSNYYFHKTNLVFFEENKLPVYLEETSDRGLFGLINKLESAIIAGGERYPIYINPRN
jgi:Mlc titration factor MtfA (ptsG expression regulator)